MTASATNYHYVAQATSAKAVTSQLPASEFSGTTASADFFF